MSLQNVQTRYHALTQAQTFELGEEHVAEPKAEERVVGVAKIACVALAGITLTFSVLDFADVRSAGEISNLWHLKVRPALASAVAGTDAEIRRGVLPDEGHSVIVKTASAVVPRSRPGAAVAPTQAARAANSNNARPVNTVRMDVPTPERLPAFMKLASASVEDLPLATTAAPLAAPVSLPLGPIPLPRPSPTREAESHDPTPAELLGLDINQKERAKSERCLANAVYFESRSEPLRGQMAVAQVVMNRVFSPFYPKDVCSVVYQNANRHLSCQFTFACDGKSKAIHDRGSWARATRIAKQTLDGKLWVPEVAKSTHYHALYVRPNWIHEMRRMFKTGVHLFYRPYNWGDGADEPGWVKPTKMVSAKS